MIKVILWVALATILSAQTFKCHDMAVTTDDNMKIIPVESSVVITQKNASVRIEGIGVFHYTFSYISPRGIISFTETKGVGYLAYNKLTPDLMLLGEGVSIGECVEVKFR